MEKEKKGGKKNVILIILAIIILIGVAAWFYYYSLSTKYFKTDNAKVSSTLYTITATTPGKVLKLNINEGDTVKEGEIIGRIDGGGYIKAPANGEVMSKDVSVGQNVAVGTKMAVISSTDDVCIKANIEETEITKIKDGQTVLINLDAYPGKTFQGHVKSVDKLTQTALSGNAMSFSTSGTYTKVTQLLPVEIVPDEDVSLKNIIGTNSTVKIRIK